MGILQNNKKAVMSKAVTPVPAVLQVVLENLGIGQFREQSEEYIDDTLMFLAYPMFDSFEDDHEFAGVLAVNI